MSRLNTFDLMVLDDLEKKNKLKKVLEYVRKSKDSTVDITNFCNKIGFKPTPEDIEWLTENI